MILFATGSKVGTPKFKKLWAFCPNLSLSRVLRSIYGQDTHGRVKKRGGRGVPIYLEYLRYNMEIKILCKLRYRTVKNYHTDHTEDTFIVLSTVYQRFSFLRTILAASVDVSTMKFIFVSYFSRLISLKNLRNLLIRFQRSIFYSAAISISQPTQ